MTTTRTTAPTTALAAPREPAPGVLPMRAAILDGESVDSWIEELARRHRLTPRALLPALGIHVTTPSMTRLIYGIDPRTWRHVEHITGLPPGRLDTAVGDSIAAVTRLQSGGSRYCPRCLADTDGRWPLSWRLNWTTACLRHRLLLLDRCPHCGTAPRTRIVGGSTPIPAASCAHILQPARQDHPPQRSRSRSTQRCGTDLTTAATIPVTDDVLAVQHWIENLVAHLGQPSQPGDHHHDRHPDRHPDRQHAQDVVADLPVVISWLRRHNHDVMVAAARRINPGRPPSQQPERRGRTSSMDAALSAAVVTHAKTILDGTDRAAIAVLRRLLAGHSTEYTVGIPPHRMSASTWQSMRTRFPNRYLRAADPDLVATQRLRMRTVTPAARPPDTESSSSSSQSCVRVRAIPQMLWPDWAGRLLPVTGFHPELFRATTSTCLLVPGYPERDVTPLAALLNPRVSPANISTLLQGFADLPRNTTHSETHKTTRDALSHVLILLCRIADHLDEIGSPIDYQRRREQIPAETITWPQWRDLACAAGAHPGDRNPNGRLLFAQRHLHQLLSGADLADPRHPLAFRHSGDRSRYIDFTTSLTTPLRHALHEHAVALLTELGIDEPLTWSPPASLADGLDLPGLDTDTLDMTTISRLVIDEHRAVGDAAQALGVHREHIRFALERLDRPQRHWATNAAPTAWRTEQRAARLFTRDFFDREYVRKGRTLHEIAETTGIGRHIIARFAKQVGITLNSGRAPFPIDPSWLREQYCDRKRSTADIAAELGTDQMNVNHALHRLGIPARPSGVASHPHMITKLGKDIPRDIRAAVEGTLHGWYRLHRFQIAMAFPNIDTAAGYLGAHRTALVTQFQRLERDIGAQLYHRAVCRKRHRATPRGQVLLGDLAHDHIQQMMIDALRDHQIRPMPDADALAAAEQQFTKPPRTPSPPKPFDGISVDRLRISRPVLTVLRDLIDHPGEFYGLEVLHRTRVDEGTLYPMLKRLERAGWLTSWPEDEQSWLAGAPPRCGPGRRRTYYTFTSEGCRAALHELHHHKSRNQKKTRNDQNPRTTAR